MAETMWVVGWLGGCWQKLDGRGWVMRCASLVRVSGDLFDLRSWIDALCLGRVYSLEIGDEQIENFMSRMRD